MKNIKINSIFQQGVSAQQVKNIKLAKACYKKVLKDQPGHPDANHNMGLIYFNANKQRTATVFF